MKIKNQEQKAKWLLGEVPIPRQTTSLLSAINTFFQMNSMDYSVISCEYLHLQINLK